MISHRGKCVSQGILYLKNQPCWCILIFSDVNILSIVTIAFFRFKEFDKPGILRLTYNLLRTFS